ncbi:MAG: 16S rRNA (cytosine(967)-C(5))-methyltransferase RsmB [Pyrinomonadaceae bacterium]|nr:16S rRNA (cytosine(967)-C(5))-methyltransferase RsmB [Pyrinomonadaceae bacterium]
MSAGKRGTVGRSPKGARNKPERAPQVSPARLSSFEILRRVEEEDAYASVLLASNEEGLRAEDRALSYEIVLGVLRRRLWLDYLIEHYTRRSIAKLDLPVLLALRMGLYQLRFLSRIPPSAVVNEAVNLAHLKRVRSAAGLINAALRRAVREPEYDPAAHLSDPLQRVSVKHSHPLWLVKRWAGWLGLEEAERFAEANNEAPPVAFRFVQRDEEEATLDELRAAGASVEASRIAPGAWRVSGASARLRELAGKGRIYIQDEASQLVAHALHAQAGERILDACAAPGSKTTHIASLVNDGALLVAGDVHRHRLSALLESCARQNLKSVRAIVHDAAASLPFASETFDRVLVDAPCTGTGTLRRNPEIRWRIRAEDIPALQALQLRILRNAAKVVRRGGRLVYSTCSVEPEENEQTIAHFLREESGWKQLSVEVAGRFRLEDGAARIWPQRDGADGFFIAALERA